MNERNLTITELAKGLGTTRANVSAVVNGRAGISPEMAVKLSAAFGNSATFWTNLQTNYELWHAERKVKRSTVRHFKLPKAGYRRMHKGNGFLSLPIIFSTPKWT